MQGQGSSNAQGKPETVHTKVLKANEALLAIAEKLTNADKRHFVHALRIRVFNLLSACGNLPIGMKLVPEISEKFSKLMQVIYRIDEYCKYFNERVGTFEQVQAVGEYAPHFDLLQMINRLLRDAYGAIRSLEPASDTRVPLDDTVITLDVRQHILRAFDEKLVLARHAFANSNTWDAFGSCASDYALIAWHRFAANSTLSHLSAIQCLNNALDSVEGVRVSRTHFRALARIIDDRDTNSVRIQDFNRFFRIHWADSARRQYLLDDSLDENSQVLDRSSHGQEEAKNAQQLRIMFTKVPRDDNSNRSETRLLNRVITITKTGLVWDGNTDILNSRQKTFDDRYTRIGRYSIAVPNQILVTHGEVSRHQCYITHIPSKGFCVKCTSNAQLTGIRLQNEVGLDRNDSLINFGTYYYVHVKNIVTERVAPIDPIPKPIEPPRRDSGSDGGGSNTIFIRIGRAREQVPYEPNPKSHLILDEASLRRALQDAEREQVINFKLHKSQQQPAQGNQHAPGLGYDDTKTVTISLLQKNRDQVVQPPRNVEQPTDANIEIQIIQLDPDENTGLDKVIVYKQAVTFRARDLANRNRAIRIGRQQDCDFQIDDAFVNNVELEIYYDARASMWVARNISQSETVQLCLKTSAQIIGGCYSYFFPLEQGDVINLSNQYHVKVLNDDEAQR